MTTPPGPVLYVALVPLKVRSLSASWTAEIGGVLPLLPGSYATQQLLANGSIELAPDGSIELAPDGAVDTVTPAHCLRGQPGLKVGVSN